MRAGLVRDQPELLLKGRTPLRRRLTGRAGRLVKGHSLVLFLCYLLNIRLDLCVIFGLGVFALKAHVVPMSLGIVSPLAQLGRARAELPSGATVRHEPFEPIDLLLRVAPQAVDLFDLGAIRLDLDRFI